MTEDVAAASGALGDRLRLLVVDDRPLYRAAFDRALAAEPDLVVVASAAGVADGLAAAEQVTADVAVVHDHLADGSGVVLCQRLKATMPGLRVVVTSDVADDDCLFAAMEAGADGYLHHELGPAVFTASVRQVRRGETVVPPAMLGRLIRRLIGRTREVAHASELLGRLTPREREVLGLMVDGYDHDAVADELVISPQTARTHIQNVITKLGVHSRGEAVQLAAGLGVSAGNGAPVSHQRR